MSTFLTRITLLFHALRSQHLQAIDVLLEAGADPYMVDRPSTGSARSFAYYLSMPRDRTDGGKSLAFINELIMNLPHS